MIGSMAEDDVTDDSTKEEQPWPDIENLPMPQYIEVSSNPEQAAIEIFRNGVAEAARTIVDISAGTNYGSSALVNAKLRAATTVVDRVLGKVKEGTGEGWEGFLEGLKDDPSSASK